MLSFAGEKAYGGSLSRAGTGLAGLTLVAVDAGYPHNSCTGSALASSDGHVTASEEEPEGAHELSTLRHRS